MYGQVELVWEATSCTPPVDHFAILLFCRVL